MKRKGRFKSIRFKILAAYMLLLFITCAGVFGFFTYRFDKVYKQQADSHMADVTQLSAVNVSNMMEQIDQLSVSVIVDQVVQNNLKVMNKESKNYDETSGVGSISANKTAISEQIRGSVFNIKGVSSLRIYSVSGEELIIGTTNRELLEYSLSEAEIYEANGAALWTMVGDANYICMCRAILSTVDLKPLGYMVMVCQNTYLSNGLSTVSGSYAGRVYLVDKENRVVTASEDKMIGKTFPYPVIRLKDGANTIIEDPGSKEKSFYYTGETFANGWTLVCTVSARQFREGITASIFQMGIMLFAAIILSFAAITLVVGKLVDPTKQLVQSMSAFGEGRLDSRVEVKGDDEIGQIGCAYNEMAENIQNLMEKVYTLELANKEAKIEFLKMQINPHFLYNSLDTISWLGFSSGNEKVSDLAVSLADLLRSSIKRDDRITVNEEMRIVQNYLHIQNYRFGDKIAVEYDIAPEVTQYYMPSFLLQPLIENGIMHGLEKQIDGGTLRISIKEQEGWLQFVISDDGKGMEKEQVDELMRQCKDASFKDTIGLSNVYRRLQLSYGDDCRFEIKSTPEKGTSISFRIPVM